jgi:hypothetical protein
MASDSLHVVHRSSSVSIAMPLACSYDLKIWFRSGIKVPDVATLVDKLKNEAKVI